MPETAAFSGFTKETVRFFTALRKNNNREWFERNRETYETQVMAPARAFVTAMGERLKPIAPRIVASPKVNKSIFRINRDTRFSQDPSPYKTNLGIYFWDGLRPRMESSGFYFHLEPPNLVLGGGMYMIPDSLIGRFREAVIDPKSGRLIARIVEALRKAPGATVEGLHYKRVPAGYEPDQPNAELLKHRGLYGGVEMPIPEELYSARLIDFCGEHFDKMAPLHRWLMEHLG